MGRPKKEIKAKKNNFTLTNEAQTIIDEIPKSGKSKFVSDAIVEKSLKK